VPTGVSGRKSKEWREGKMTLQGMIDYFKEQSDVAKESWKMSEDNVDAAKYWAYHLAYKDAEFKASNIKEGEK
jgi:hypothetical protein